MRVSPTLLVASLFTLNPGVTVAQTPGPLVTDRPDFTESALAVGPGRVQLEAGYTFSGEAEVKSHTVGEVLVRVGLISRLELRLGLNSYAFEERTSADERGFEDVFIGAKIALLEVASGFELLRPGLALLIGTSLPTGQGGFGAEGVWPEAKLALGWDVSQRFSLGSNLNVASVRVDGDRFGQFSGSLAMGYAISERLGTYLEYFGFAAPNTRGIDESFFNGGFTFLANNDLQFDARAGIGVSEPDLNYFLGVGFAWRI